MDAQIGNCSVGDSVWELHFHSFSSLDLISVPSWRSIFAKLHAVIMRPKTIRTHRICRRTVLYLIRTRACNEESWTTTSDTCKWSNTKSSNRPPKWAPIHLHFLLPRKMGITADSRRPRRTWIYWKRLGAASCTAWKCTRPKTSKASSWTLRSPTWASPYSKASHASTPSRGPKSESFRSSASASSLNSTQRAMWVQTGWWARWSSLQTATFPCDNRANYGSKVGTRLTHLSSFPVPNRAITRTPSSSSSNRATNAKTSGRNASRITVSSGARRCKIHRGAKHAFYRAAAHSGETSHRHVE